MADEPTPIKSAELNLYRCDGLDGGAPHWSRQRNRVVRMRWWEGDDWQTDVRALCLTHYQELRAGLERQGEG
jgi:hypothetical protein